MLFGRQHLGDSSSHAVGSTVAVVHRISQQPPVLVEQGVIDRPGINGYTGDVVAFTPGEPQPVERARPERQHVPVQRAVHGDGTVDEAVHLAQLDAPLHRRERHHRTCAIDVWWPSAGTGVEVATGHEGAAPPLVLHALIQAVYEESRLG